MKKSKKIIMFFLIIFIITFSKISFSANANNQVSLKKQIQSNYQNNITLDESIKKSTLNHLLTSSSSLQSKYDLRNELNNNIVVKNQYPDSNCWAYAYTSVLETTMAKKGLLGKVYSPMHIDYTTSKIFNRNVLDGGTYNMALAYSVSGYGPVYESDFAKESVYDNNNVKEINQVNIDIPAKARVLDSRDFPSINKSFDGSNIVYTDAHGNSYNNSELTVARNLIKKHIMENGAVFSSFYISNTETCNKVTYNDKTVYSYFYNGSEDLNHAITIVGWDDNFPKENFALDNMPIHDGAYIVLNSWGNDFGDNGFFYVSYDDKYIEKAVYGITNIQEINDTNKYDNLYEYDELGNTTSIIISDIQNVHLANVFKRSSKDSEYLSEIGLSIDTTKGVKVYVNPDGDDKTISEDKLVLERTGNNALEPGYHTLQFTPVKLTGTKFTVIVEYINNESKLSVPLELNLVNNNIATQSTEYKLVTSTAKSERGQSFINIDSNWIDLCDLEMNGSTLKDANACIKAFTKYVTNQQTADPDTSHGNSQSQQEQPHSSNTVSITDISLNLKNKSIEVGDTVNLIATITPANATNQKIIWKSENESIAKVVNGIVYGISEGTTKILAITEDGNHTANFIVTITKKTNTDNDIYKDSNSESSQKQLENTQQKNSQNNLNASSTTQENNNNSSKLTSLPYTGNSRIFLILIIISIAIVVYNYYKNKKYKKIKF